MKKLLALFMVLAMIFSFAACGEDDGSGGGMSGGPMAYTVKKCTYVYPSGKESVVYTAELKDDSFIMNNLIERFEGEVDRSSMIFNFNANGITSIRREDQDFEKEIEDEGTTTLKYDEATSTLTKETVEEGKITDKYVYNLVWDSEGRLASYKYTSYYYDYDDAGNISHESKYEYNYSYSYGADSFTITQEQERGENVNGEYRDVIKRIVSTIPYAEKADITKVETYFELDGTTPVNVEYRDKQLTRQVIVSNWWGYVTSDTAYYTDGSTSNELGSELTFDNEGRIVKEVSEGYKSNGGMVKPGEDLEKITITIDFNYDDKGNLTEIKREEDGITTAYNFEWMEIPEKLDTQIAMFSGSPHWSVAEYIDNFIEFNWEGRLTVRTYKLADFLNYVQ